MKLSFIAQDRLSLMILKDNSSPYLLTEVYQHNYRCRAEDSVLSMLQAIKWFTIRCLENFVPGKDTEEVRRTMYGFMILKLKQLRI